MTGAQAVAPEGFLTLADALDRAQSVWHLKDETEAVGTDVIAGGVGLFAGGKSWMDPEREHGRPPARTETWNRVRRGLANGNVASSILRSSGDLEGVPPDVWRRKENADADLSGQISYTAAGETISGDVFIKLAELADFLSGKVTRGGAPSVGKTVAIQGEASNKGGRPFKYDWDAMWVEVLRIALHDSFPRTSAELRRRLQDWFSASGRAVPQDSAMKEKLRPIFAMIDAEEKKAGN
jgi:hypothetical protein